MCGIAGFNWEDRRKIEELACLLRHRGPEQEGYHVGDNVSIGHRRLCILDLSEKGRQPIYNEDRTVCISFNGEIFNFKELREMLEKKGHKFESKTDTEVIVHGYEQWGTEVLKRLNGQFAFCIFDRKKKQFFIARDRLGIKPLYYYSENKRFIFGSELKILLKSGIEREINKKALEHYLLFGYTPREQSILENVKKLPPGHYLIYDLAGGKIIKCEPYWSLSFSGEMDCTEEDIKKQIAQRLDESVRAMLIADVPVGAFLSGGIDSSTIVAIMSKYVKDLKTFSIKFDYPEFNESGYAKIISDKFQTEHHEIEFNAEDVRRLIPKLVYHYDEPFGDPSMIPTYLVSTVAKKYVTVCLSGTGGDELFGGYPRYSEFALLKKINQLPVPAKRLMSVFLGAINSLFKNDKLNKLNSFFGEREQEFRLYLMLFSYMFRDKNETIPKLEQFSYLKEYFKYGDDLSNMLNFDINEYLPNCLLEKEDKASMAVSLEVRVPFLDHRFVEFAARIPSHLKIKNGEKKYILKKSVEGILPNEIIYRRKQGFGVPLVHYFRNELRDFAYDEIFNFEEFEYYDKGVLKGFWERHQKGELDYSPLFWSIIMFNLWYKEWMAGCGAKRSGRGN